MRLTPIDIQQQHFHRAWHGVETREVQSFLDLVAQQVSELVRENGELRVELRRMGQELDEHRNREETLREAMLTAQRAIDEIREQAKKEAQVVIADAELRAEKILHNAHGRAAKLVDEINDLRRRRTRFVEELRGILNTHSKLLDLHDGQEVAGAPEASVLVLDRLRAPAPPMLEALAKVEPSR
jgi:cell division initiation protein